MSSSQVCAEHFFFSPLNFCSLNIKHLRLLQDAWKAKEQSEEARYAHSKVSLSARSYLRSLNLIPSLMDTHTYTLCRSKSNSPLSVPRWTLRTSSSNKRVPLLRPAPRHHHHLPTAILRADSVARRISRIATRPRAASTDIDRRKINQGTPLGSGHIGAQHPKLPLVFIICHYRRRINPMKV
jgi:hypothetical protein